MSEQIDWSIPTVIRVKCHLCPETFDGLVDMRDHWQRDHHYTVTIKVTP